MFCSSSSAAALQKEGNDNCEFNYLEAKNCEEHDRQVAEQFQIEEQINTGRKR